jgi:hypothetical protein
MPGPVPGWGSAWVEQTAGKILSVHVYRNDEERWCRLLPCSILFRLVTPLLQPGVVGAYLVRGVWLPSHLLLEGVGRIQMYGA